MTQNERDCHYNFQTIPEAIKIISEVLEYSCGDLSVTQQFCLGNALKYMLRAGKKSNTLDDIRKDRNYLNFLLEGEWIK